jgi:hypothetical protein
VGGIGSCGRELCCSTWLTDFKSVNTNAARYQNLSINQTKLSGQCGRLKCCLNYELDTYMDALQYFPNDADVLEMAKGRAFLAKKDIFRNLMWYTMPESNKQYPLSLETVKRIKAQNREGIRPEEFETVEVVSSKPKEVEPEYADLVGQISLKSLEKTTRKRRDKERSQQRPPQGQPQHRNQPQNRVNSDAPQQRQAQSNPGNRPQQGGQPQGQGGRPQGGGYNRGPQRGGPRNKTQQPPSGGNE